MSLGRRTNHSDISSSEKADVAQMLGPEHWVIYIDVTVVECYPIKRLSSSVSGGV